MRPLIHPRIEAFFTVQQADQRRLSMWRYPLAPGTQELNRRRLPRLADHTLATIYQHLFPAADFLRQSHRALDDARMTARIWLKLSGAGPL